MNRREFLRLAASGVAASAVVGATGLNPLAPARDADETTDGARRGTPTERTTPTATPEPDYRLWAHDIRGNVGGFVSADRGSDLFVSIGTRVYRIAGRSGRIVWEAESEQEIEKAVCVAGDDVFAAGRHGRVVAVDRQTGDRRWFANTDAFSPDTPLAYGDTVALPGDRVYGFDVETGDRTWTSGERFTLATAVRSGRYVYAGSGRHLARIDLEDGTSVWNWDESPARKAPSRNLVLDTDRDRLFGTYNWTLYAVDATDGSLLWTAEDEETFRSLARFGTHLLYHVRTDAGNPKLGAIDLGEQAVAWEKIAPLDVDGWEYGTVTTDLYGRDGTAIFGTGTGHLVELDPATGDLEGAAAVLDDDVARLHVAGDRAFLAGDNRITGIDLSTLLAGG